MVQFEHRHRLRAEIHNGEVAATDCDASGIAAYAAHTLRVQGLNESPADAVDQELIVGSVGRRDHQGGGIDCGLGGSDGRGVGKAAGY